LAGSSNHEESLRTFAINGRYLSDIITKLGRLSWNKLDLQNKELKCIHSYIAANRSWYPVSLSRSYYSFCQRPEQVTI
jgi:hypothetical protein